MSPLVCERGFGKVGKIRSGRNSNSSSRNRATFFVGSPSRREPGRVDCPPNNASLVGYWFPNGADLDFSF